MVKKRVIKFFTALLLFGIILLIIEAIFVGKISSFSIPDEEVKINDVLQKNQNSLATAFSVSDFTKEDVSFFTVMLFSLILIIAAIKFVYNYDRKIKQEVLFGRVDKGLIKLDLP